MPKRPQNKYVRIRWNGWDFVASYIKDDKELHEWLMDGSLEDNDTIFEIKRDLIVRMRPPLKAVVPLE